MSNKRSSELPMEMLPNIDELPGDLAQLARVIEEVAPGMGVRIVLQLVKEYRGTPIYIRNLDDLERRVRDQKIIDRYGLGERVVDIARDVGLSDRQIWKILGREPGMDKQLKLF